MKGTTVAQFTYPKLQGLQAAYDEEGYAIVRQVLDAELLGEANRHIDWLIDKHPELRTERLGHWLVADDPFWLRLIGDDRLLDVAEQLIGPDIALFAAAYVVKRPGTGGRFAWHQDGNYWPLEPLEVASLWIACSASNRANGCVRIIPGTQHLPLQERDEYADESAELLSGMDQSLVDESKAVDLELEPGDLSLHHPHIIHGSNVNTSERWRRGGSFLYIPTTTRIRSERFSSFLLRGEGEPGINTYHELPKYREGQHFRFRERTRGDDGEQRACNEGAEHRIRVCALEGWSQVRPQGRSRGSPQPVRDSHSGIHRGIAQESLLPSGARSDCPREPAFR